MSTSPSAPGDGSCNATDAGVLCARESNNGDPDDF